jgi:hypothetical protein
VWVSLETLAIETLQKVPKEHYDKHHSVHPPHPHEFETVPVYVWINPETRKTTRDLLSRVIPCVLGSIKIWEQVDF